jgi:hypothetical protein
MATANNTTESARPADVNTAHPGAEQLPTPPALPTLDDLLNRLTANLCVLDVLHIALMAQGHDDLAIVLDFPREGLTRIRNDLDRLAIREGVQ